MSIRIKNLLLPAFLVTAVGSCTVEEPGKVTESFDMHIIANVDKLYEAGTRVNLYNEDTDLQSKKLFLYGWNGDKSVLSGSEATYSAGAWTVSPNEKLEKDEDYTFFAYSEIPSAMTGIADPVVKKDSLSLTVTDIASAQEDVLLGKGSVTGAASGTVNMDFSHPFASVIIQVGVVDNLKSVSEVSLGSLIESGETSLTSSSTKDGHGVTGYAWSKKGSATAKLEKNNLTAAEGDTAATFVVIPQDLSTQNSLLTIKYTKKDNSTSFLTKVINTGSWTAGYTTRYTIGAVAGVNVAVTSTKSGSTLSGLAIQNTSDSKVYIRATIAGAWYKDNVIVAPWESAKGNFQGLPGTGWTKGEGEEIYYYDSPLDKGQSANSLFTSYTSAATPVEGASLELSVLIQAIPYNINKSCIDAFKAL